MYQNIIPLMSGGKRVYFADDFNDNSFDTAKWARLAAVSGFSIAESSQQFSETNTGTAGADGIVTQNAFSMSDRTWMWNFVGFTGAGGHNLYTIGIDSGFRYFGFVYHTSTGIIECEWNNGITNSDSGAFVFTSGWLRLKYVAATDTMTWESSPDTVTWTTQRTVASFSATNGFVMSAIKFRLQFNAAAAAGTATYDSVSLKAN